MPDYRWLGPSIHHAATLSKCSQTSCSLPSNVPECKSILPSLVSAWGFSSKVKVSRCLLAFAYTTFNSHMDAVCLSTLVPLHQSSYPASASTSSLRASGSGPFLSPLASGPGLIGPGRSGISGVRGNGVLGNSPQVKWPPGRCADPEPAVQWRRGGRYFSRTTSSITPGSYRWPRLSFFLASGAAFLSRVMASWSWGMRRRTETYEPQERANGDGLPHRRQERAVRPIYRCLRRDAYGDRRRADDPHRRGKGYAAPVRHPRAPERLGAGAAERPGHVR
jgi:hypothetical protein